MDELGGGVYRQSRPAVTLQGISAIGFAMLRSILASAVCTSFRSTSHTVDR